LKNAVNFKHKTPVTIERHKAFKKISFLVFGLLPTLSFLVSGCAPSASEVAEGKAVAERSCVGCHAFPDASLLPKETWKKDVLPMMAVLMGVSKEIAKSKNLTDKDLIFRAKTQMVTDKEWAAIKDYYLTASPNELEKPSPQSFETNRLFKVEHVKLPAQQLPNITNVTFAENMILACDELNRVIWQVNPQGQVAGQIQSPNTVADIQLSAQNELFVTYVGTSVQPTLLKKGFVEKVNMKTGVQPLLKELYRPVQGKLTDFNKDKKTEILVAQYGLMEGKLSLFKPKNNDFEEQVIENSPGAIDTQVLDFDADGDDDIMALFAQGNERIMLYKNDGHGGFEPKELLRFPPVYGSSSISVADFNGDGKLDLAYTCGDNADYSMILKPYHGLYVFSQQADGSFKQSFFQAADGAYKTQVADFDADGDADLAMISFYSAYNEKQQKDFVYFDNQNGNLKPQTLSIEHLGRWLAITKADIDNDGDQDLLLGSHPLGMFTGGIRKEWKENSGVVILRNNHIADKNKK
jgi:mono/diheme cytochrome c family protein